MLYASETGELFFDVVTLMPPTWKNRPNGLRIDLAERLADLKLKYVEFPGGCTAESASMDACWNWKNSIGPLEQRPGSTRNRWGYKNDLFFGLDDYFQLCEDLGAEPIYVTSAGISEIPKNKNWFAVCPLDQMQPIIDDVLDLVEYCNGSTATPWGAKRSANGHPEPYRLQYIEIGNENGAYTVDEYLPRYSLLRDAIVARYPEMKIIFNGMLKENAPSHPRGKPVDFTDEHFYQRDLSTFYNKYDSIDPECKKICVAEYASSIHGNNDKVCGNFGDALNDAAFMLGCEKNSERLWWTGYGNYAGFLGHSNDGPCLVWNDAVSHYVTPAYYMQKTLFSENLGTRILPFTANAPHCYWSASLDTESGRHDVLLKVVHKSAAPETVAIELLNAGKINPVGHSQTLQGDPEAENTLAEPTRIVPSAGEFRAAGRFDYVLPAYSVSVLRIEYSP